MHFDKFGIGPMNKFMHFIAGIKAQSEKAQMLPLVVAQSEKA